MQRAVFITSAFSETKLEGQHIKKIQQIIINEYMIVILIMIRFSIYHSVERCKTLKTSLTPLMVQNNGNLSLFLKHHNDLSIFSLRLEKTPLVHNLRVAI